MITDVCLQHCTLRPFIQAHQTCYLFFFFGMQEWKSHIQQCKKWDGYTQKKPANCFDSLALCYQVHFFQPRLNDVQSDALCLMIWRRGNTEKSTTADVERRGWKDEEEGGRRRKVSRVYDRFFLLSKFLKLAGLIFISTNSIECSWPFQWNQLIPWGKTEHKSWRKRLLRVRDLGHRSHFPIITHHPDSQNKREILLIHFFITAKVKNKQLHNTEESVEHLIKITHMRGKTM